MKGEKTSQFLQDEVLSGCVDMTAKVRPYEKNVLAFGQELKEKINTKARIWGKHLAKIYTKVIKPAYKAH